MRAILLILLPLSLGGCINDGSPETNLEPPVAPQPWQVQQNTTLLSFPADTSQGIPGNVLNVASTASADQLIVALSDPYTPGFIHISTYDGKNLTNKAYKAGESVEFMAGSGTENELIVAYREGYATAKVGIYNVSKETFSIHILDKPISPGANIGALSVLLLPENQAIIAVSWLNPPISTGYYLYLIDYSDNSFVVEKIKPLSIDSSYIPMGDLTQCGINICVLWTDGVSNVNLTKLTPTLEIVSSEIIWNSSNMKAHNRVSEVKVSWNSKNGLWFIVVLEVFENQIRRNMDLDGIPTVYVSDKSLEWNRTSYIAISRMQLLPNNSGFVISFPAYHGYYAVGWNSSGRNDIVITDETLFLVELHDGVAVCRFDRDDPTAARLVVEAVV